MGGRHGSLDL